uniref:Uncharacterized protein n=1 Tax=Romanomermis culicivorax TaxID=13658 RepID=A0A915HTR9_ROMCU
MSCVIFLFFGVHSCLSLTEKILQTLEHVLEKSCDEFRCSAGNNPFWINKCCSTLGSKCCPWPTTLGFGTVIVGLILLVVFLLFLRRRS